MVKVSFCLDVIDGVTVDELDAFCSAVYSAIKEAKGDKFGTRVNSIITTMEDENG